MPKTLRGLLVAILVVGGLRFANASLPLTPSTTYVANSTPVIKAQDLNDLQKYLAGLYSAIYSVKALVIDGTGGNAVTPVAGTVKVSATQSGQNSVAPFDTASVAYGQIGREQAMLCAAHCTVVAGVIASCGGFNIKSVVRSGTGTYTLQCNTAGPNSFRHVATITPQNTGPTFANINTSTISGGAYQATIEFYDQAGTPIDPPGFMAHVTGG